MTMPSLIFLAGASRGVGREIARLLAARGTPVKALLRSPGTQAELEAIQVQVVLGDALDGAAVERAMLEQPIAAVVSTIGGLPQDGERADFKGNKHLIDAAVKAGVNQFILVSSLGTGNSASAIPPRALEALWSVLQEKEQAENYLVASGLPYTIIRPGGLLSEPATGNGVLTEDPCISGSIHRADVADLVCRCLGSERAKGKTLAAVDRQQIAGQPSFEEFHP